MKQIEFSGMCFEKYFGEHYGRINPPRIVAYSSGDVDFDFGKDKLTVKGIESFAGLVTWYLAFKINRDWLNTELQKSFEEQHQLAVWRRTIINYLDSVANGRAKPGYIGADICFRYLGYHLTLIADHAELSGRLIKRLRTDFQATRFEIRVAAAMITAGFDLEYKGERGPGKHPEFIATDLDTGKKYAIEAKSKQRDGVLGFKNPKVDQLSLGVGARRLLRDAVEKDTELPLIAFIELNIPDPHPADDSEIVRELDMAWGTLDKSNWEDDDFPCIGGFFINDAAAYYLEKDLDLNTKWGWSFRFEYENRHQIDSSEILSRIEKGFATADRIPDINWNFKNI